MTSPQPPAEHADGARTASSLGGFTIAGAAILVIGFAIASVLRWDPPWNSVFLDDFTRTLHAMRWADQPFWAEPGLMWLPGHTYLLGALISVAGTSIQPLALSAALNTALMIGAGLSLAATAWIAFRSRAGALLVLVVALVAPWTHKLALSGLAEPLYITGMTVGLFALARWLSDRSLRSLGLTAAGLSIGVLVRFDAWAMWGVSFLIVAAILVRSPRLPARRLIASLGVILLPGAIPIAWAAASWVKFGKPLAFFEIYSNVFLSGFGGGQTPLERLLFYPAALVRSDPYLAAVVSIAVVASWLRAPRYRPLIAIPLGAFGLLWAAAIVSGSIGFPPERFMHGILLSLAWTLGVVPALLPKAESRSITQIGVAVGLAAFAAISLVRWSDRPEEWTFAPDLLELSVALAGSGSPLEVFIPADLSNEDAPISVLGSGRVHVTTIGSDDVAAAIADDTPHRVVVDRFPERLRRLPVPNQTIGRFGVFATDTAPLSGFRSECGDCRGWQQTDEFGITTPAAADSPMLALQFTGVEARPGNVARLTRVVTSDGGTGSLELIPLYGRGFNLGRLTVEVRLGDQLIYQVDSAEPGGWRSIEIPLPDGCTREELSIAVIASETIEPTWGWGRASDLLVRSVDLGIPCP
ncbi:MAG: hypothetical protein ACXWH0_05675 [Acidimicrobiia bacterium]